jgi:uncharacterized protein (DUF433 family)
LAVILRDFLPQDPYGEIRLSGHRIGLFTVVRDYKEGASAEDIAERYPTLPILLVRQVLGFYHSNLAEVDAYVADYQAELDRQEAKPPGPGVLKIRQLLEARKRG